jgi:uncharacterized protein YfdQ (DUF2303 family)
MDKTAIQEITRLAVASFEGAGPLNDGSAIVIPDAYQIRNLERYEPTPKAFKGTFFTTVLDEFIRYVNQNGNENSKIFIDQQEMLAEAIIDMGEQLNPLWGRYRAKINLLKTPAYTALLKLQNQTLTQQDFIDFAEDWQANVHFYFGDFTFTDKEPFPNFIRILRRVKVTTNNSTDQNVNNFSNSHSALESIEIKSDKDQLPDGFVFSGVPYEGFQPINFNCQLRAVNDDKTVKLKYRIGQLDLILEAIAYEFKEVLFKKTDQKLNDSIFIGKMTYQD